MINKYIKQKEYIENNPTKIDTEKLEKHEHLKDQIIMKKVQENYTDDKKPFYDYIKKEVIK